MKSFFTIVSVFLIFSCVSGSSGQDIVPIPDMPVINQNILNTLMDTPHWGNGIECSSCHVTHNSPGAQLTNAAGNANLCMSCHNPVGMASDKPFAESDKAIPGVTGTSHAWNADAENISYGAQLPANNEMARRVMDGKIVCSTCHNQHSQTYQPFLRMSNEHNAMCKDCHAVRNVGSYRDDPNNKGSHPVGIAYPVSDSRFFAAPTDTNLTLVDPDKVECTTCHGVHYTDSGGANNGEGDGYLLHATNSSAMCESCHTYPDHEGMDCLRCHQPHDPKRTNIFLVRDSVLTPESGTLPVIFTAETGANSFADGDNVYDGICEVCHTTTNHFRNDGTAPQQNHENLGGKAGTNCTDCHPHSNGFKHGGSGNGCISCHGHDAGYEYAPGQYCEGDGTAQSHSTHTENDADDLKGPFVTCDACHDTSNYPYFKSGIDQNNDGLIDLSETDVCNTCHSPNGTYDGVNDAVLGAKHNWKNGIYSGDSLAQGKAKWCATCHDESAANSKPDGSGVNAPNVVGNENASYPYGIGWGYYKTGHGLASGSYPSTGAPAANLGCEACHDPQAKHIDHIHRTYKASSDNYQSGYRLKYSMDIPRTDSGSPVSDFELCFQCHPSQKYLDQNNYSTNFRDDNDQRNSHAYHLGTGGGYRDRWDSDWDGNYGDSQISCPACHNVHGSPSPVMIRHGELISTEGTQDKVPSLDFEYTPEGTFPTLMDSKGGRTRFIGSGPGSVSKNGICSMCHNDSKEYIRTPHDLYPPKIMEALGQIGSDSIHVHFTEGVYANNNSSGDLQVSDFQFYDNDDQRTIVRVEHVAGQDMAILVLDRPLDANDDLGVDAVSAADNYSIYDESGNAMEKEAVTVEENYPPDQPQNINPPEGQTNVSVVPTLESSYFSDANPHDAHRASQWQITSVAGDYTAPVYNHISTTDLTSHQITVALEPYTTYYWHVRYQDNNESWSDYSQETMFVTGAGTDSVILHPSGLASNPGGFSVQGSGWEDALDQNDGDLSIALKCCGPSGDVFSVNMDDYAPLNNKTIQSFTINVLARYSTHPNTGTEDGYMNVGYKTGNNTKWLGSVYLSAPDYVRITSDKLTTDSDNGTLEPDDINNIQIFIKRDTGGPDELRVTEIYINVKYQ